MSRANATTLLRPGLLSGVSVLVAGARAGVEGDGGAAGSFGPAVASACGALGAQVSSWQPGSTSEASVDLLVIDGGALFAPAPAPTPTPGGGAHAREALRACLDGAWEASTAVANAAFIEPRRGGRIVYVAPASGDGAELEHADAARAGLENLGRTLSIEWARYAITTVTIAPGVHTAVEEVAALVGYLASPAGDYFSGCLLDLRGTGTPREAEQAARAH